MPIERVLRDFLNSPTRPWIVVIITFGIGLLGIWPAADEYFAARSRRSRLMADLVEGRHVIQSRDQFQQKLEQLQRFRQELGTPELSDRQVHLLHGQIVEFVRKADCQTRNIVVGDRVVRSWADAGLPLPDSLAAETPEASRFELGIQPIELSVSGSMTGIKQLLKQLATTKNLTKIDRMSLEPSSGDRTEVVLRLELLLLEVKPVEPLGT